MLFSVHGQRFPSYGPIFKIAIFGHETWPLAKVSEVAHILPKLPPESQISLRFALRLPISKILAVLHFPIQARMLNFNLKKKIPISNFCEDCHREHLEKVWSIKNNN